MLVIIELMPESVNTSHIVCHIKGFFLAHNCLIFFKRVDSSTSATLLSVNSLLVVFLLSLSLLTYDKSI